MFRYLFIVVILQVFLVDNSTSTLRAETTSSTLTESTKLNISTKEPPRPMGKVLGRK